MIFDDENQKRFSLQKCKEENTQSIEWCVINHERTVHQGCPLTNVVRLSVGNVRQASEGRAFVGTWVGCAHGYASGCGVREECKRRHPVKWEDMKGFTAVPCQVHVPTKALLCFNHLNIKSAPNLRKIIFPAKSITELSLSHAYARQLLERIEEESNKNQKQREEAFLLRNTETPKAKSKKRTGSAA